MQGSRHNGESVWRVCVVAANVIKASSDIQCRDGSSSHEVQHAMVLAAVSLAAGLRHDLAVALANV